jgi:hypothetical protein
MKGWGFEKRGFGILEEKGVIMVGIMIMKKINRLTRERNWIFLI